jgi:hypothetical protein
VYSQLKLRDEGGKIVAENDGAVPFQPDARLFFTPLSDGNFQIVATASGELPRGAYTLTIRAFAAKPK